MFIREIEIAVFRHSSLHCTHRLHRSGILKNIQRFQQSLEILDGQSDNNRTIAIGDHKLPAGAAEPDEIPKSSLPAMLAKQNFDL
jgi:hypothetical protein